MIFKTLIDDFNGHPLRVMGSIVGYTVLSLVLGRFLFEMSLTTFNVLSTLIGVLILLVISYVLRNILNPT